MRASLSFHRNLLLLMALACGWMSASAQSNAIENLLKTNQSGQYPISPIWVGETKTTAATGVFASRPCMIFPDRPVRELRFELINVFDPSASNQCAPRVWSQSFGAAAEEFTYCSLHLQRDFFPTDAQLLDSPTIADLTKLLGPGPSLDRKWGDISLSLNRGPRPTIRSAEGWEYFRFNDANTLETLSVFCFYNRTNGQSEAYVDSIRIRRGTAKPVK